MLTWMVNDIIEELLKPTHKAEDERTPVGGRGNSWDICRSLRYSIFWRIAFAGMETGFRGQKGHEKQVVKNVSLMRKCDRTVCHVSSAALNWRVNWPWSMERVMRVKRWESKILRLTCRPSMKSRRRMCGAQEGNVVGDEGQIGKMKLPTTAENNAAKVWRTKASVNYDGDGGTL